MEKYLTQQQIKWLAESNGYEYAALKAVIARESSGHGFSSITGKIVIQFEPLWFKKFDKKWNEHIIGHLWQDNLVGNQTKEWMAFNDAYAIDSNAAMKATSIGMMQVMGYHYALIGFKTVGEMWDYAKISEYNQVDLGIRFINKNPALSKALKDYNWADFAYRYNGKNYKKYNYDTDLAKFYTHYKLELV